MLPFNLPTRCSLFLVRCISLQYLQYFLPEIYEHFVKFFSLPLTPNFIKIKPVNFPVKPFFNTIVAHRTYQCQDWVACMCFNFMYIFLCYFFCRYRRKMYENVTNDMTNFDIIFFSNTYWKIWVRFHKKNRTLFTIFRNFWNTCTQNNVEDNVVR